MRRSRPLRYSLVCLALAIASSGLMFGCGGGDSGKVIEVSSDFQKQNNAMLEQMSKKQMEKYKKGGSRKR